MKSFLNNKKDKKIICTTRSHASHDVNACIEAMKPDEILRQGKFQIQIISIEIMEDNQILGDKLFVLRWGRKQGPSSHRG